MSAPRLPQSQRSWRVAALLVLAGGIAVGLWIDPDLLDENAFRWPLAGVFAVLWVFPVLRARMNHRPAAQSSAILWQDADPQAGRNLLDSGLGLIAGLLGGALVLSIPGAVDFMSSGPQLVSQAFDIANGFGIWAGIFLAVALMAVLGLLKGGVFGAVRASRFIGGLVIGLCLWVPFHTGFAGAFARMGFELQGLASTTGSN